jgi:hypothetical protein
MTCYVSVVVHKFIVGLCVALLGDRVLNKFSDIRNMECQTLYEPLQPAINTPDHADRHMLSIASRSHGLPTKVWGIVPRWGSRANACGTDDGVSTM